MRKKSDEEQQFKKQIKHRLQKYNGKTESKKVSLYLHKLCPERKSLQDMTADSVHSLTGRKGPDSCYSDLVCQSMSNSPRDTALLQTDIHKKHSQTPQRTDEVTVYKHSFQQIMIIHRLRSSLSSPLLL